jgi:hypothetical protein
VATNSRTTQPAAILGVLLRARGDWVPLPQILALGIAQYGARIHELRKLNFQIENRQENRDGKRHTWFRLRMAAASTTRADQVAGSCTSSEIESGGSASQAMLFDPIREHVDLG